MDSLKLYSQDASNLNSQFEHINVEDLIKGTMSFHQKEIEKLQIKFEYHLPNDIYVKINLPQMTQAINQLIENSIDALRNTTNPHIIIRSNYDMSFIKLSFCDNGSGVPVAFSDDIFLPFFTTKEIGKGTGLGLSIAKGIIEQHQGILALDKNKEDTIFSIKLPIEN